MAFKKILWYITENPQTRFIVNKCDWTVLKNIGSSKFIQSFTIWMVFVPIFAKVFNQIPDEITIGVLDTHLEIVCQLPFRLTIFYFCALLFGSSTLIYKFACPPLIKDYKSGSHFIETGGSIIQLKENIEKLDLVQIDEYKKILEYKGTDNIEQRKLDLYTKLVNDLKLKLIAVRFILVFLYFFGFIFLLWIFLDNTLTVIGV